MAEPSDSPQPRPSSATEILSGLWQGDLLSGVQAANSGFDVVVDLTPPPGARRTYRDGMLYIHWPMEDGASLPDMAMLDSVSELCARAIRTGKRVLVHCSYGRNRSGLICALVVRSALNCSGQDALAYVRSKREGAVQNRWFAAYLAGLP